MHFKHCAGPCALFNFALSYECDYRGRSLMSPFDGGGVNKTAGVTSNNIWKLRLPLQMDFSPGSMAERRVAIPYQHYVPRFQVVTAVWSSTVGLIAATIGIVVILVILQGREATGVASFWTNDLTSEFSSYQTTSNGSIYTKSDRNI